MLHFALYESTWKLTFPIRRKPFTEYEQRPKQLYFYSISNFNTKLQINTLKYSLSNEESQFLSFWIVVIIF